MNKGTVESLDFFGQGIIKEDGKCIFVKNALPGEVVSYELLKNNKKFAKGETTEIEKSSAQRIDAPCPHYGVCGGCQFQHVSYEEEVKAKEDHVKNVLRRIGGFKDIPFLPMDKNTKQFAYRNKVVWHLEKGKTGFFKENSKSFLPISSCLLLEDALNEATAVIDTLDLKGIETLAMRSNEKGEIAMVIQGKIAKDEIVKIEKSCPNIHSIYVDNYIHGNKDFSISLGKIPFELSPKSFFQVNRQTAADMLDFAKEALGNDKKDVLLDLYCGVGAVGIYLADNFKNLYGIESFKEAVGYAEKNAKAQGVKAQFMAGKIENTLTEMLENINKADVVVVDPPRSGLDKKVAKTIKDYGSNEILYISCDPGTMSRDLYVLSDKYTIKTIKPFNLFPRTAHVECVVLMSRVSK
ncbi:MAG: class I SAM-dependent RNA methyltransferase [Clostridiales bacterium]